MPQTFSSRRTTLAVAAFVALSGCTTAPVVNWKRDNSAAAGSTIPKALSYLDSARSQYRDAVADQMNQESAAGTALIGAGALIAALAVGKVHRDAILATSFLAGTGYAVGSRNLQRPRVLIYQAGVEALNCAERAVAPFAIGDEELKDLLAALNALDAARLNLSNRVAEGQGLRNRALGASQAAKDFDALLPAVQVAQQASDTTVRAGREFAAAARVGARQLVAAVNSIDAAVVRSIINETPDLSSVPKVISGLAGMIGSFAPGAGVEALIEQRLADVAKVKTAAEGQKDPLDVANENIRVAARELAARHAEAAGHLAGRAASWPEDAFKDCGVANVVAALSASPSLLQFVAGASSRRLVDIAGGVKPYFVEIDGPTIDGLTVKAPVRFDARAEISIDGTKLKTPVETVVRITDSSPTARTLSVPLSVAAAAPAPAPAPPPAPAPAPAAAAPTPTPAAGSDASKLAATSRFNFKAKAFIVSAKPRLVGDTFEVGVICPMGNAEVFKRAELATALITEARITTTPPPKVLVKTNPDSCAPS